MKKFCSKCGIEKDYSNFSPNKKMTSGCINTCKQCISAKDRADYGKVKPYGNVPRSAAIQKTKKQSQVVKYGLDISNSIDSIREDREDFSYLISGRYA